MEGSRVHLMVESPETILQTAVRGAVNSSEYFSAIGVNVGNGFPAMFGRNIVMVVARADVGAPGDGSELDYA